MPSRTRQDECYCVIVPRVAVQPDKLAGWRDLGVCHVVRRRRRNGGGGSRGVGSRPLALAGRKPGVLVVALIRTGNAGEAGRAARRCQHAREAGAAAEICSRV